MSGSRSSGMGRALAIGAALVVLTVVVMALNARTDAQAQTMKAGPLVTNLGCVPQGAGGCIVPADGDQTRMQNQLGTEHGAVLGHDGTEASLLGQCAGCHLEASKLPEGHVATADVPLAHCSTCHAPQTDRSLSGRIPLDHIHALAGYGCASCHDIEATPLRAPDTGACQSCHGSLEDIASQTVDVSPTNPHDPPHGAPYVECSLCHLQHAPSENFCATCHDFEFNVP